MPKIVVVWLAIAIPTLFALTWIVLTKPGVLSDGQWMLWTVISALLVANIFLWASLRKTKTVRAWLYLRLAGTAVLVIAFVFGWYRRESLAFLVVAAPLVIGLWLEARSKLRSTQQQSAGGKENPNRQETNE